ncbi:MAG TPA: hypothetical protein ENN63_13145 [Bacteroidetes bacterium]|nr:hypothetical protein [Bacteroidota bacterium]
MPYRRLPNTDNARLRALKTALEKGRELPPFRLAFSQKTLQEISSFLPSFETGIQLNRQNYSRYVDYGKKYQQELKKARLYLSHFIQVMNMSIQRGELPESTREYFRLSPDEKTLPPLQSEDDVITWGERIIEGENQRIRKGLSPVTNPTMAMVRVWFEKFMEGYRFQKTMLQKQARSQTNLANLRSEADRIIVQVWNEVEDHFRDLPDEMKREKAGEYGVTYVYRKNEMEKQNHYENGQKKTG